MDILNKGVGEILTRGNYVRTIVAHRDYATSMNADRDIWGELISFVVTRDHRGGGGIC